MTQANCEPEKCKMKDKKLSNILGEIIFKIHKDLIIPITLVVLIFLLVSIWFSKNKGNNVKDLVEIYSAVAVVLGLVYTGFNIHSQYHLNQVTNSSKYVEQWYGDKFKESLLSPRKIKENCFEEQENYFEEQENCHDKVPYLAKLNQSEKGKEFLKRIQNRVLVELLDNQELKRLLSESSLLSKEDLEEALNETKLAKIFSIIKELKRSLSNSSSTPLSKLKKNLEEILKYQSKSELKDKEKISQIKEKFSQIKEELIRDLPADQINNLEPEILSKVKELKQLLDEDKAKKILNGESESTEQLKEKVKNRRDIYTILEFFEHMGLDVKLDVVDENYLKEFFFVVITNYYEIFKKFICYRNEKFNNKIVYCNFVYLAQLWEQHRLPPRADKNSCDENSCGATKKRG